MSVLCMDITNIVSVVDDATTDGISVYVGVCGGDRCVGDGINAHSNDVTCVTYKAVAGIETYACCVVTQ